MSNARNLADLLDANGDVKSGALDNVSGLPDAVDVNASAPADTLNIDSSGNVLVGASANFIASTTTATGLAVIQDGRFTLSRSGTPMFITRLGSDGDLIQFWKQGSNVGTIGVVTSDRLYIGTPDGSQCAIRFDGDTQDILPSTASGTALDNSISLGDSGTRFKDLYLSGGVYVGGTGSANYLDDYEEGTFTPVMTATTSAPTISGYWSQIGTYTKIGNVVAATIDFSIQGTSGGSGNIQITGLPFTSNGKHFGTMAWESLSIGSNVQQLTPYTENNQSNIYIYPSENNNSTGGNYDWDGGLYGWFKVTITYKTNS